MGWGRLVEFYSTVCDLKKCYPVHEPVGERCSGRTQICVEDLSGVYAHSVLVVD